MGAQVQGKRTPGKAGKGPQPKEIVIGNTPAAVAPPASSSPVTATAPPIPAQPKNNGVTRPRSGTSTGRVWEIADTLSKDLGKPAPRADVMKAFEAEGGNQATGATQYGRWRKFHGLNSAAKSQPHNVVDTAVVEVSDVEVEDEDIGVEED